MVKISSREMTINDALIEKSMILLKKDRLLKYKALLNEARSEFELATEENKKRVEKIVQDKSASSSDTNEKDVSEMIDKTYPIELIDPSKLDERIKILEKEVEEFESNVDFALSEINSITKIEIPD